MILTECSNSFEYNSKVRCLRKAYPGEFENIDDIISIGDRRLKVTIIKMVAEKMEIPLDQILFVDDSYSEVMEAFDEGIFAIHTTELIDLFSE